MKSLLILMVFATISCLTFGLPQMGLGQGQGQMGGDFGFSAQGAMSANGQGQGQGQVGGGIGFSAGAGGSVGASGKAGLIHGHPAQEHTANCMGWNRPPPPPTAATTTTTTTTESSR